MQNSGCRINLDTLLCVLDHSNTFSVNMNILKKSAIVDTNLKDGHYGPC